MEEENITRKNMRKKKRVPRYSNIVLNVGEHIVICIDQLSRDNHFGVHQATKFVICFSFNSTINDTSFNSLQRDL